MKKVFSLLLVVAMLVSMSVVASAAPANAAGGMHTVLTESETDITVDIYVSNVVGCSGFTSLALVDGLTYVDGSAVLGDLFAAGKLTVTTSKAGQIKMTHTHTDLANVFDNAGTVLAMSYKVTKDDPTATLTEDNFKMGTTALTVSKVVTKTGGTVAGIAAGNNFTSAKQPAYFTVEVIPFVPEEEPDFGASAEGTTITCFGKVAATATNYGVVFTKESTVEGARAQKYYGAMPGDTVKDYNGSTTFTFGDWDGSFEIILEGVHAGEKELDFFVDDTVIADTNFTVNVQ
ncbi:MAG: hypothetical protein IJ278_03430 [Clostridia bacterium]|nr:hypothetical protein [Clostridia bacterium]